MGFHSSLPASPSVLSSGDLFGFVAIGVLKAKDPDKEEGADSPDQCPEPGLSAMGGVSRAGRCGESRGVGIGGMDGS